MQLSASVSVSIFASLIFGGGLVLLYNVFQPFVTSLMWAVLIGAFIHPLKTTCRQGVESWLDQMEYPLAFELLLSPLRIIDFVLKGLVRRAVPLAFLGALLIGLISVSSVWSTVLQIFSTIWARVEIGIATTNATVNDAMFSRNLTLDIRIIMLTIFLALAAVICLAAATHIKYLSKFSMMLMILYLSFVLASTLLWKLGAVALLLLAFPHVVGVLLGVFTTSDFLLRRTPSYGDEKEEGQPERGTQKVTREICLLIFIASLAISLRDFIPHISTILALFSASKSLWRFFSPAAAEWFGKWKQSSAVAEIREALFFESLQSGLAFLWTAYVKGDRRFVLWVKRHLNFLISLAILIAIVSSTLVISALFLRQIQLEITGASADVHRVWVKFSERVDVRGAQYDYLLKVVEQFKSWSQTAGMDLLRSSIEQVVGPLEIDLDPIRDFIFQQSETSSAPALNMTSLISWENAKRAVSYGYEHGIINSISANLDKLKPLAAPLEMFYTFLSSKLATAAGLFFYLLWTASTGIINILMGLIAFLTTLFYLLDDNHATYKPMIWIGNIIEIFLFDEVERDIQLDRFEKRVYSIFASFLKIAIFHGLLSWVTLTLLNARMCYLTSFLSAFIAAVPFLSPFWVCVPSVAHLWLVEDRGVHALALFFIHYLASFVFDPMVYDEIEGVHAYVVGLSVFGGTYIWGIEGSILGPLLLCSVEFAISLLVAQTSKSIKSPRK